MLFRSVDIAFALFAAFDFNFIVEEFLSVDDCQAAFFCLGGVNEHPFHGAYLHISKTSQAHDGPTMPERTSENEGNCRSDRLGVRYEHSRRGLGAWIKAGSDKNFTTTMGLLTRCNPLMRLKEASHQLGVFRFSVC